MLLDSWPRRSRPAWVLPAWRGYLLFGLVPLAASAVWLGWIPAFLVLGLWAAWYYWYIPRRFDTWRERKARRELWRQVLLHEALLTGALIFILPFVWLVSTSLKPDEQIFVFPPQWIPRPFQWKNYPDALRFLPEGTHYGLTFLLNTLYITLMNVIGVVFTSSLVAYSFARLRWPGREVLFVLLLSTMMLPAAVTMIPVFLIYKHLGWVDTLRPLWVGAFLGGGPFYIFLLRQFFLTIPRDLEEAAKIDGCSFFGIYWRIMLPLIKPALAAIIIMQFMASWNDFMGPLIYISAPEKMNLAYALQLFQTAHGSEWSLLMAASTLVTLPVIVVFFFTQRHFIEGVTLTGIKG
ncbi:MAG TPA: carbohydrate ABC transporter permease [Armatimonadetes bacterium]|nr:carbohydrate ABC transporter permease [Armatimonadota bacterium]